MLPAIEKTIYVTIAPPQARTEAVDGETPVNQLTMDIRKNIKTAAVADTERIFFLKVISVFQKFQPYDQTPTVWLCALSIAAVSVSFAVSTGTVLVPGTISS